MARYFATDLMHEGMEIIRQRETTYGNSGYHQHAAIINALFPNGLKLEGEEQFGRWALLGMIIAKVVRYSNNITADGHDDSMLDIGNYAFLLLAYDKNIRQEKSEQNAKEKETIRSLRTAAESEPPR